MKSRIVLIIALLSGLFPDIAGAENSSGFLYSRSDIPVIRNTLPAQLPWLTTPVNPAITFDVEVRDAANVYNQNIHNGQTGWFNLSSPEAHNAVMMLFHTQAFSPIVRSTEFAPLDVLLIDADGTITQIITSVKLSELDHEIVPEKPVIAFMFLQGGLARKSFINVGDRLDSPLFKKSTLVIDTDKARVPKQGAAINAAPAPRLLVPALPAPAVSGKQ